MSTGKREVVDTIEYRKGLRNKISNCVAEYELALQTRHAKGVIYSDIQKTTNTFEREIENLKTGKTDYHVKRLSAYREELESAAKASKESEELVKTINSAIGTLQKSLDDTYGKTDIDAILIYQKKLKEAEDEAVRLSEVIQEQKLIISDVDEKKESLNQLLFEQEDLLADAVSGKVKDTDLKQMSKKVSDAEEVSKLSSELALQAQKTISGLQRKLVTAQQKIDELSAQKKDVHFDLFKSEAEKLALEYLIVAEEITHIHSCISVLIQKANDCKKGAFQSWQTDELLLPSFALDSLDGKGSPLKANIIFSSASTNSGYYDQIKESEILRFRALGLDV